MESKTTHVSLNKKSVKMVSLMNRIQLNHLTPNFFCSVPYWIYSKCKIKETKYWMWLEVDDVCLFPPIPFSRYIQEQFPEIKTIWSDFVGYVIPGYQKTFLDYQFIYNPDYFKNMNGSIWEKFRKNSKKWPKNHLKYSYGINIPEKKMIGKLMGKWMEKRQDSIQDPEIILQYVLNPMEGVHQKYLFYQDQLMGINVWDDNFLFLNYRFCIADPEEPFLDEFLRLLFYTDPEVSEDNRLINDGGSLGSPGLERFKNSLNPVLKLEINTWTKI